MVIGLERFKAHFAGLEDSYILIGGSACDVNLNALGGAFRVTKDLDIVLCIEARTNEFARAFWCFIREGGYAIAQRSSDDGKGRKLFYRFQNPSEADYPKMLELLCAEEKELTYKGCYGLCRQLGDTFIEETYNGTYERNPAIQDLIKYHLYSVPDVLRMNKFTLEMNLKQSRTLAVS